MDLLRIDLANTYSQTVLSQKSEKKLYISTHQGVVLHTTSILVLAQLTLWIYIFRRSWTNSQEILPGVAVYLNNIMAS